MKDPRKFINVLERRIEFLQSKEYKSSYDLAEAGALSWACENLRHLVRPVSSKATTVIGSAK